MADCKNSNKRKWKKKWTNSSNKSRRKRYKNDEGYRQEIIEKSRQAYRAGSNANVDSRNCIDNLDAMASFGTLRDVVFTDGCVEEVLTFTIAEVAKLFGDYSAKVMSRWINSDRFPAPAYKLAISEIQGLRGAGQFVYLEEELLAVMPILANHQSNVAYLTKAHVLVIDAMFTAVEEQRDIIGG